METNTGFTILDNIKEIWGSIWATFGAIFDWINSVPKYTFGENEYPLGLVLISILYFALVIFCLKKICQKFKIMEGLEASRKKIVENIKASEEEKKNAEEEYKKETETASHIDEEIYSALDLAEKSAQALGKKMLEDANKITRSIITSTQKRIDAQTNLLQADLLKRTALASVEVAKERIQQELEQKPELHDKFIYESVEALNEVKL